MSNAIHHSESCAVSSATPPGTNRGVANVHSYRLLVNGIDQLKLSCFGELSPACVEFVEAVKLWKSLAAADPSGVHLGEWDGEPVAVRRNGSPKVDGPYYPFLFQYRGLSFQMYKEVHPDVPFFVVTAGAMCCIEHSHDFRRVGQFMESVLCELGFRTDRAQIRPSRLDHCRDTTIPFAVAYDSWSRGEFVLRAIKANEHGKLTEELTYSVHSHGRRAETITVGKAIKLRVYDKSREMLHDFEKAIALLKCWQGYGGQVTRCEWQLNRDAMKDRGIVTLQDLYDRYDALVQYLTNEWSRVVAGVTHEDRQNLKRKPFADWWAVVAAGSSEPVDCTLDPKPRFRLQNITRWLKQLQGTFLAFVADHGRAVEEEIISVLSSLEGYFLADGIGNAVREVDRRQSIKRAANNHWRQRTIDRVNAAEFSRPWWDVPQVSYAVENWQRRAAGQSIDDYQDGVLSAFQRCPDEASRIEQGGFQWI